MNPFPVEIQNDLIQVNECLKYILHISTNAQPTEQLTSIKLWAIEALKKLPVSNNDIIAKYS